MSIIHKHHIIPRHMGGTDDKENIIELSVHEHAMAHLRLYEEHNKPQDLLAYQCLMGYFNKKEIIHQLCKLGGTIGGNKNRESGHMSNLGKSMPLDLRLKNIQIGVEKSRELKLGCFFNNELRLKSCSLGGKVQGKINSESGHCKRISENYWQGVKEGTIIRIKLKYITNDIIERKIPINEIIPDGWHSGRLKSSTEKLHRKIKHIASVGEEIITTS